MSAILQGSQLRTLDVGLLTTRAAATLPQTATQNIFTISGGRILVTSFVGLVTAATGATATTLKVSSLPTVGSVADLCIAVGSTVSGLAAGALLTLPAAPGSVLTVTGSGAFANPTAFGYAGLLIPAGNITITTSASDTGQIQWDLTWIPFDDGASVAAA